MLLFDYKCPYCQKFEEDVVVKTWNDPVHCSDCGQLTTKQLAAPAVNGGFADGFRTAYHKPKSINSDID